MLAMAHQMSFCVFKAKIECFLTFQCKPYNLSTAVLILNLVSHENKTPPPQKCYIRKIEATFITAQKIQDSVLFLQYVLDIYNFDDNLLWLQYSSQESENQVFLLTLLLLEIAKKNPTVLPCILSWLEHCYCTKSIVLLLGFFSFSI